MKDLRNYGMDITIDCNYDTDLSQIYFEDNFEVLQYGGYRTDYILNFIGFGDMKGIEIDFNKLNKEDLLQLIDSDYYSMKDTKEELLGGLYEAYEREFKVLLNCTQSQLDKLGFYITVSRGYRQGDYATILINTKEYKKVTGADFKIEEYQRYFNNLLWDSPISINFQLRFFKDLEDGFTKEYVYNSLSEDLYCDEYMKDIYKIETLDYTALIETIKKDLQLSKAQLDIIKDGFSNLESSDIAY